MYIKLFDRENLISVFTTKRGSSPSPFMNYEVRRDLGLESIPWVRTKQVHEDRIAVIDSIPEKDIVLDGYDALVTTLPGVCLATAHADCTPVQLYDPVKKVCAVVHAGWRGTALNIAGKVASLMRDEFGCEDTEGYIGPAISLCCFEVGDEVSAAFSEYSDCIERVGDKDHVDLKRINALQLRKASVKNIGVSELCTFCNDSLVSYRREKATDKRTASIICMKP